MSALGDSFRAASDLVVHADAVLIHTVLLSLGVSGLACLLAGGLGLFGGAWLAVAHFPGHRLLLLMLNTLLNAAGVRKTGGAVVDDFGDVSLAKGVATPLIA